MKFYDQISATIPENIEKKTAHIIGGGIAGLAAINGNVFYRHMCILNHQY